MQEPGDHGCADAVARFDLAVPWEPDVVIDAQSPTDVTSAMADAAERGETLTVLGSGHGRLHERHGGSAITLRHLAFVDVGVAGRTAGSAPDRPGNRFSVIDEASRLFTWKPRASSWMPATARISAPNASVAISPADGLQERCAPAQGRVTGGCRGVLCFLTAPFQMYFAGHSVMWGGSSAFLDTRQGSIATTHLRAYLITEQQFEDVVAQENGR